jgi:uncharacterized membrane protein YqjE
MNEQDPRSITAVMHGIVGNVEDLVQAQVKLAKAELIEVLHQTGRAAKLLGVGAALGQLAVGFMLLAAVSLLASIVPLWAAALIVGGAVGLVAIALILGGAARLRYITPPATTSFASHGRASHG